MKAMGMSSSITKMPMIHGIPITTVREMEAFNQFLLLRSWKKKCYRSQKRVIIYFLPESLGFLFFLCYIPALWCRYLITTAMIKIPTLVYRIQSLQFSPCNPVLAIQSLQFSSCNSVLAMHSLQGKSVLAIPTTLTIQAML